MILTQQKLAQSQLTYALFTEPAPAVQVGLLATLTLVVSCPRVVGSLTLAQLTLRLPVGTDATDLLATAPPQDAATVTSSDHTKWVAAPGLTDNVFSFAPKNGQSVLLAGQSLTIILKGLAINAVAGTAQLTVLEWAAPGTGTPPDPTTDPSSGRATIDVPKFPQGFTLDPLKASPSVVDQGGSTTLSWDGSQAIYQLEYVDSRTGDVLIMEQDSKPLPEVGSYEVLDLQDNPTVFTLTATLFPGGPFLQQEMVVSVVPAKPIITAFTAKVIPTLHGPHFLLNWDTVHADGVTINSQEFSSTGTFTRALTAAEPLLSAYELTATNKAGSVTARLEASWVVAGSPVTVGKRSMCIAITPDGTQALVTNLIDNTVSVLTRSSAGQWTAASPVTVGKEPWGVAITLDGNQALVFRTNDNTASVLTRSSAGQWTVAGSTVTVCNIEDYPWGVAITPDGTQALVVSKKMGVSEYTTDTTVNYTTVNVLTYEAGQWTAASHVPLRNAQTITITPDGTQALVTNDDMVSVLTYEAGQWTAVSHVNVGMGWGNSPSSVAITPNGTQALVTCGGTVSVLTYEAGQWTVASHVRMGNSNLSVAITPDGTQALVTSIIDNTVSVLTRSSAGQWAVAGSPVTVGKEPWPVAITPDGTQALVINATDMSEFVNNVNNTVSQLLPSFTLVNPLPSSVQ